jgi:hypothetical protein
MDQNKDVSTRRIVIQWSSSFHLVAALSCVPVESETIHILPFILPVESPPNVFRNAPIFAALGYMQLPRMQLNLAG